MASDRHGAHVVPRIAPATSRPAQPHGDLGHERRRSDQHQITNLGGANFAPYFTPDGRKIIFSSNYKNPKSRDFELYLVNDDGSALEQVTHHVEFDGFPMFSPDGTKLVWASGRSSKEGELNLFLADWKP